MCYYLLNPCFPQAQIGFKNSFLWIWSLSDPPPSFLIIPSLSLESQLWSPSSRSQNFSKLSFTVQNHEIFSPFYLEFFPPSPLVFPIFLPNHFPFMFHSHLKCQEAFSDTCSKTNLEAPVIHSYITLHIHF